ncbi:MAG: hypothetical protein WBM24_23150, partial [Candidatus Sulfotelmatobacter sp.]
LNGSGHVTLTDNTHNSIVSDGLALATLTNSNTITGAGTIGDTQLTLINSGTIDATGTNALIIDTGTNTSTAVGSVGSLTVRNNAGGILEASAGHTLQIDDNVLNNGLIEAGNAGNTNSSPIAMVNVTGNITGTGSIEIFNNAKVEIGGSVSSGQTVNFEVANGHGELILDNSHVFNGLIIGLVESPSESSENYIDLKDFHYVQGHMSVTCQYHLNGNTTTVTFADRGSSAPVTILLSGNFTNSSFEFANDGAGGTLVDDPPANSGIVTIDSGTTLDIPAASTATVIFSNSNGNTGELVLNDSRDFTGQIVGFAGDGTIAHSDLIDLADVNIADVAMDKTTYTDNGNGIGTLTLYNAQGQALDGITFAGSYHLANFTIESDGSGHTLIVDPPTSTALESANTPLTTGIDTLTFDNSTHQVSGTDQTVNNGDTLAGGTGANTLTINSGNGDHSYTFGDGNHADVGLTNFEKLTLTDDSAASDHAVAVTFDSSFHNNGTLTVNGSGLTHLDGTNLTVDAHLAASDSFVIIGSASADTLIGGSNGNNTITGGGGGDFLTGGGANNTFVYKAITDSQPGAGNFDTVTNFTHNSDHFDFTAINGLNSAVQPVAFNSLTAAPDSLAAHTIDIVTSGGNTVIYANASGAQETVAHVDMEIHLNNVTNVHSTDFILHA